MPSSRLICGDQPNCTLAFSLEPAQTLLSKFLEGNSSHIGWTLRENTWDEIATNSARFTEIAEETLYIPFTALLASIALQIRLYRSPTYVKSRELFGFESLGKDPFIPFRTSDGIIRLGSSNGP